MNIGYFAGPGDICATFRYWEQGLPDPNEASITYSSQFFDMVRNLDARGFVVSTNAKSDAIDDGKNILRNFPFVNHSSGFLYIVRDLIYSFRILLWFVKKKIDVLVWSDSASPWMLVVAKLFGIKVIFSAHCIPEKFSSNNKFRRLRLSINRLIYVRVCSAILCVSDEVSDVFAKFYSVPLSRLKVFSPSLRSSDEEEMRPRALASNKMRILYVGRVVRSKGVFDLLDALVALAASNSAKFVLRYCGSGSDLAELERRSKGSGNLSIEVLGHCQAEFIRSSYAWATVVVVPTRSEFMEGFNKVVAEAASFGVPIVATDVCPAIYAFPDAVFVVPPDSPAAIVNALNYLSTDAEAYFRMSKGGLDNSKKFRSSAVPWGVALAQEVGS